MTSKTAAQHGDTTLIPLADLEAMLASVMAGREYLSQGPHMTRTEAGWEPPAPLPPDRGLRLSDFLSVIEGLPDPCPEPDAAMAVCQVIRDRGHRFLVTELEAEWESRWPSPGQQEVPAAIPSSGMRCMYCGGPIPPERGPKAKFCRASHRVSAHRKAKRAAERANAGASPGR